MMTLFACLLWPFTLNNSYSDFCKAGIDRVGQRESRPGFLWFDPCREGDSALQFYIREMELNFMLGIHIPSFSPSPRKSPAEIKVKSISLINFNWLVASWNHLTEPYGGRPLRKQWLAGFTQPDCKLCLLLKSMIFRKLEAVEILKPGATMLLAAAAVVISLVGCLKLFWWL